MRIRAIPVVLGLLAALLGAPAAHGAGLSWQLLSTGHPSHFRGLAAVSRQVAWLGGYDGTVLRTTDGGQSWQDVSPPGAGAQQFRDVSAFDANHAVAMAAGSGGSSRLYETTDGGRTWRLSYGNRTPGAFFDCMSFSGPQDGLVLSDPVDGRFRILRTTDGGYSWHVLPSAGMPPALAGEAGFAASGQCLTTLGRDAWFGGGGGSVSRIFHSTDFGTTWTVSDTPIPSSPSGGGIFGLAFRTPDLGVAVGGNFSNPTAHLRIAATSQFGGPWRASAQPPGGYRSGVSFVPRTRSTVLAVGLTGSDVSYDGGRTWQAFDSGQFDTVSCALDGACWASGDLGRVAVLNGT